MLEFFQRLFSTEGFMPHGHCYFWETGPFWLNVLSDLLIAASYFSIPFGLYYFVSKRKDLNFKGLFLLFAAFILLCGVTHIMSTVGMWYPFYRLEGILKLATGLVSATTAVVLVILIPKALAIPSIKEYQDTLLKLSEESKRTAKAVSENQLKSEFIADMSHEIRTPMTGIRGGIDLLGRSNLSADQQRLVQIVSESSDRLLLIINDILDLSKIEAGKLELVVDIFSVADIVNMCVDVMELRAREKNLPLQRRIDETIPTLVRGDSTRICQILNNLLSNAIKFTRKGQVELSAVVKGRDENGLIVRFEVSDTGSGIHPDRLEKIFEAFTQETERTALDHGGTGLGLTISQRLALLMGGNLTVTSELGKGSVFALELPLALPTPEEEAMHYHRHAKRNQTAIRAGVRGRVLVVEDIENNRLITRRILIGAGHGVEEASKSAEAVAAIRARSFDLILMDIRIGSEDGCELAKTIRRIEQEQHRPRTPIVALSAQVMKEEIDRALASGMDAYLTKPITADQLLEAVARQLLAKK